MIETLPEAQVRWPFTDLGVLHDGAQATRDATCRAAATAHERDLAQRIRQRVFVDEQGLFTDSDRDERDDDPATIHLLGLFGDLVVGTVRLYRLDEPGGWKGDRLAVLPEFRHTHLGGLLVKLAVRTAGAAGGRRMAAHVQVANVPFFERLGWLRTGDPETFVGVIHQQMVIDLESAAAP